MKPPDTRSKAESVVAVAERLVDQYQAAAASLIAAQQAWAAVLMLCCGIDSFAAFRSGRANYLSTAREFVTFVKAYMPVFAAHPPSIGERAEVDATRPRELTMGGRLAWAGPSPKPVESCAEVLYRGYRCGLIHQGKTSPGLNVVDVQATPVFVIQMDHLNGDVAYRMDLNVRSFYDYFLQATGHYIQDLSQDGALQEGFRRRWGMMTGPQWVWAAQ